MKDIQIKDQLVTLRKAHNLTQSQLAEHINYSDKVISKWERGESYPDVFALKKLSEFFGVSIDDIVGNTRSDTTKEPLPTTKLDVIKTERPSLILRYWILIPLILLIVSISQGPEVFGPALFVFGLLGVLYFLLLAKQSFEAQYQGHRIRIVNRLEKCELFINDELVDGAYGMFQFNPELTGQIGNHLVRVKISNMTSFKCDVFVR
ncbi:MAG: helix-turn-helix domain-containing protein [Acholeplasmataceae bacterium]|nr:helix-turn-helix domain-containing protein [Acholeplasmataceae bacterium]